MDEMAVDVDEAGAVLGPVDDMFVPDFVVKSPLRHGFLFYPFNRHSLQHIPQDFANPRSLLGTKGLKSLIFLAKNCIG